VKDTIKTNPQELEGPSANCPKTVDANGDRTGSRSQISAIPDANKTNGDVPALEVRGLWTGYNGHPALEDINFQVAQGEIVVTRNGQEERWGFMPAQNGLEVMIGRTQHALTRIRSDCHDGQG